MPATPAPHTHCPVCGSTKIRQVPLITGESQVTRFKCFDCGRLFQVPEPEPLRTK